MPKTFVTKTFSMSPAMIQAIEDAAANEGENRSWLVRDAVRLWFKWHEYDEAGHKRAVPKEAAS